MNHKRLHTRLLALLLCCALVLPLSACGEDKSTTQQRAVRQPAHQNAPNQVRRDAEYVAPEKFPILQFPIHQLSYWTT